MKPFSKKELKSYRSGNKVRLVYSGQNYFKTLEEIIRKAKRTIHFHTYIFKEDQIGKRISESLAEAAKRGIKVFLLIDTFGSSSLSHFFIKKLRDDGVNLRFFSPLISGEGFQLGRRLHQKVVVVDGQKSLIGGINIIDRYHGIKSNIPWLDFAVLIEGDICQEIENLCFRIWEKKFIKGRKKLKPRISLFLKDLSNLIRIRQNDWMRGKAQISKSYKYALSKAEESITIIGAYFLPSRKLRKLLKKAGKRGVKIKIILSQKSDGKLIKKAMNYLYDWLLRNNIEIYEYLPAVVHGKAAIIDKAWTTIGSHDLNFLSTYGLVEMNIDILNERFSLEFNDHLEKLIKINCRKITKEGDLENMSILDRLINFGSYWIMSITLLILILLTTKEYYKKV